MKDRYRVNLDKLGGGEDGVAAIETLCRVLNSDIDFYRDDFKRVVLSILAIEESEEAKKEEEERIRADDTKLLQRENDYLRKRVEELEEKEGGFDVEL